MLENYKKENVLFLDIETVPQYSSYLEMPETFQKLWDHKALRIRQNETEVSEDLYQRAGIYAEFGQIICISVGFFHDQKFRMKSFAGHDEKLLLEDFALTVGGRFFSKNWSLCAHNGKEFDFPYIARRMLINGIKLPVLLDQSGKKPWEVPHLDTMDLWRFGDYKNYTSLELLAAIFQIPTPKDDIRGSDVARVYWEEKDLPRIVRYCEKDVATIARIFLRYKGEPLFSDEDIEIG
ncbi:MAG: 3'-5' exonuclease [Bacteroidales bacterium]|nr:3'-5' exonuclease [Bacteroidales bacterium]MDZ4205230.1 3'-5' exonuclease [Bacteroidales bacterium]